MDNEDETGHEGALFDAHDGEQREGCKLHHGEQHDVDVAGEGGDVVHALNVTKKQRGKLVWSYTDSEADTTAVAVYDRMVRQAARDATILDVVLSSTL